MNLSSSEPERQNEIGERSWVTMRVVQVSIKGWYSGTSIDSQDTLAFSARSGVRPMNEIFPLERASEAYDRMMSGKARFRVVLTIGG
jgi:D-arabinose 1-dehydrogenase-like Zn-dependent alcohol dehydrogenase